ncbi:branched-chain amino acid ABC transporter permease [Heliomarina baculiformis]|uniref:branched-chain amino acid ABC transporter permease n=1 Tax=Heliomarina baculiformis TaxID=2872036 RepID=UPI001EE29C43|nr:branched-chain amino acid ABC transporter permease [Heliomarina baculiformis]
MDTSLLVIQTLNGLQLGLLLFLVASGLTLVFGILDFVNLAHGSLYMLGAFFCATLTIWFGSFILALLISLPITALVGYLVERFVARPLYSRDHLDHVLATFGLILVIDTLTHMIWGPEGLAVPLPDWLRGQVTLWGDTVVPTFRLMIIGAGLAAAGGLFWLVNHTRLGMLIRAGASNRTMVSALGIDIEMLFGLVFALGAALAGLAGMLIAPITEANIGMGNGIIITAFVVIIVGGIGSIKGAFIAALLIGLIDTLGRSFLDDIFTLFMSPTAAENSAPAISAMLIYIIMACVLAFRPQGLFPPKVR